MTGGKINMCPFSSRTYACLITLPGTVISVLPIYSPVPPTVSSRPSEFEPTQRIYVFFMMPTFNSDYIHTWH